MRLLLSALCMILLAWPLPTTAQEQNALPDTESPEEYDWDNSLRAEQRVAPRYPSRASDRGQDGWVHMGITVQEDGTVGDMVVVASYPPGVFETAATRALEQWTYVVPGEGDDYTLPQKRHVIFTFELESNRGARRRVGTKLRSARNAITDGDHEKADRIIGELSDQDETGWLNLYELAVLEQTKAMLEFGREDWAASATHAERTLRFGMSLGDGNIATTHRIRLFSYVNSGKYPDAVRAYDEWRAFDEDVVETPFAPVMEQIRQALADGRPVVTE